MTPALESLIRSIAFLFPGVKLEAQGGWREVRQATEEEKVRWGWPTHLQEVR